jgi:hypothetical protein
MAGAEDESSQSTTPTLPGYTTAGAAYQPHRTDISRKQTQHGCNLRIEQFCKPTAHIGTNSYLEELPLRITREEVSKGTWWMSWHPVPMKDVAYCEKRR